MQGWFGGTYGMATCAIEVLPDGDGWKLVAHDAVRGAKGKKAVVIAAMKVRNAAATPRHDKMHDVNAEGAKVLNGLLEVILILGRFAKVKLLRMSFTERNSLI